MVDSRSKSFRVGVSRNCVLHPMMLVCAWLVCRLSALVLVRVVYICHHSWSPLTLTCCSSEREMEYPVQINTIYNVVYALVGLLNLDHSTLVDSNYTYTLNWSLTDTYPFILTSNLSFSNALSTPGLTPVMEGLLFSRMSWFWIGWDLN